MDGIFIRRTSNSQHRTPTRDSARTAASHSRLTTEEEGVVILQEVKASCAAAQFDEAIAKVRAAINRVHGIDPMEIALLPRRTIALTSSGKLPRWQSRLAWAEHRMPFIARWSRISARRRKAGGTNPEQLVAREEGQRDVAETK